MNIPKIKKRALNELALFAGAGGGLLASKILRWNTVAACEIQEYPRRVIMQRQRDGLLEKFPIWDDVCTFDGRPWRGSVDVISGGFPCQDISASGKGAGLAGARSGLWKQYKRIIKQIQPGFVFAENSPMLRTRGLATVIKDLTGMGYHVRWCVLGAGDIGANHHRDRMWILAHTNGAQFKRGRVPVGGATQYAVADNTGKRFKRWPPTSRIHRADDGVANRLDRLKAIGNGQVPAVASTAWRILTNDLEYITDEVAA